jgi:hypothetical protein
MTLTCGPNTSVAEEWVGNCSLEEGRGNIVFSRV